MLLNFFYKSRNCIPSLMIFFTILVQEDTMFYRNINILLKSKTHTNDISYVGNIKIWNKQGYSWKGWRRVCRRVHILVQYNTRWVFCRNNVGIYRMRRHKECVVCSMTNIFSRIIKGPLVSLFSSTHLQMGDTPWRRP